jgi:hypothetical protein
LNLCSEKEKGLFSLPPHTTQVPPALSGILLKQFKIFGQQGTTVFSYNNANIFITKYYLGKLFISAENKVASCSKGLSTHVKGGPPSAKNSKHLAVATL